jgi:hypothetical protein
VPFIVFAGAGGNPWTKYDDASAFDWEARSIPRSLLRKFTTHRIVAKESSDRGMDFASIKRLFTPYGDSIIQV